MARGGWDRWQLARRLLYSGWCGTGAARRPSLWGALCARWRRDIGGAKRAGRPRCVCDAVMRSDLGLVHTLAQCLHPPRRQLAPPIARISRASSRMPMAHQTPAPLPGHQCGETHSPYAPCRPRQPGSSEPGSRPTTAPPRRCCSPCTAPLCCGHTSTLQQQHPHAQAIPGQTPPTTASPPRLLPLSSVSRSDRWFRHLLFCACLLPSTSIFILIQIEH